ncbi:MAG TPA: divergent PAP2 family protein [Rectinemataceae bacterium]|nr:divergent PAP2 family protein [Rectinemataceae bacterium]
MAVSPHHPGATLFSNPVFLSAVFSLLLAQFVKAIVNLLRLPKHSLREALLTFAWKTGGMPSSHSALAVSISTSIAFKDGLNSDFFVLSAFFALVVIRDALGVRHSSGIQARTLNTLGRKYSQRFDEPWIPIKEVMGHTPSQVFVGSLLGFFIALAFSTL